MNKKGQNWLGQLSGALPVVAGFILAAFFYMTNQPDIAKMFFWGGLIIQAIYIFFRYGRNIFR